jgi:hypothetical protein
VNPNDITWLALLALVLFAAGSIAAIVASYLRWRRWYRQVLFHVERPPSEIATRGSIQDFHNLEKH